jgi:uncharacterized protein involved in outer membrane biogenesis
VEVIVVIIIVVVKSPTLTALCINTDKLRTNARMYRASNPHTLEETGQFSLSLSDSSASSILVEVEAKAGSDPPSGTEANICLSMSTRNSSFSKASHFSMSPESSSTRRSTALVDWARSRLS